MVLVAIPSFLLAQTTPFAQSVVHPGALETMRQLTEFDKVRLNSKISAVSGRKVTVRDIEADSKIDIDPDFLNSIILNTPATFMALAAQGKCAFYNALLADLLRTRDGKIEEIVIQYQKKDGTKISAVMGKRDFIDKVIAPNCPNTAKLVSGFQINSLDAVIKSTAFDAPTSRAQCDVQFNNWVQDSKSPFWCQIDEVIKNSVKMEKKIIPADKNTINLGTLLRRKLGDKIEYLSNFCANADSQQVFCTNAFSSSFFSRITDKSRTDIYIKDICQEYLAKNVWSPAVANECASILKREPDACLWGTIAESGLSPRPSCDQLSLALNNSSLWANYDDCPRYSDNQAVTNVGRILLNIERPVIGATRGLCSAISAATVLSFNRKFDNEAMWTAGVCYFDKIDEKEKCLPAYNGDYGDGAHSITRVMGEVLSRTKGADRNTVCKLVSKADWNPQFLDYKYGCFIAYDPDNCGFGQCSSKIYFNEKEIKGITIKSQLAFDYFPNSLVNEKFSQTYILQRDAQKQTRALQTLPALQIFFKENPKGIIHGIGCAEDLLPGFFKKVSLNQCTPLPFIVDGLIQNGDRSTLVTRSAADDVHAPRLLPWGQVFSAVKSFQVHQPLKQWTLHAIY